MSSERGFSYLEMLVIVGLVGVASAVAIPSMMGAIDRNRVITSADLVAAQIRSARLAAISRNQPFRVRFDCPAVGALRVLAVTGDNSIDTASDRCSMNQEGDGPPIYIAEGVSFVGTVPTLQVSGRGEFSAISGTLQPITVSHGSVTRTVGVSGSGRVSTQ